VGLVKDNIIHSGQKAECLILLLRGVPRGETPALKLRTVRPHTGSDCPVYSAVLVHSCFI
jgi:hypothetical protein